jgi:hypothetical protein
MLVELTKEELPVIHVVWLYHIETSDVYGRMSVDIVVSARIRGD